MWVHLPQHITSKGTDEHAMVISIDVLRRSDLLWALESWVADHMFNTYCGLTGTHVIQDGTVVTVPPEPHSHFKD